MAYTMPDKIEDNFEDGKGFRSEDSKPLGVLLLFWLLFTVFFLKGIILKGAFFLFIAIPISYWLLLPAKKYGKTMRNWQIYYTYCFRDKKTYLPPRKDDYEV